MHFYSRKYYDDRIKPEFEERMETLKRKAARENDTKLPNDVKVRAAVTREQWDGETPGFQAETKLALEREHQLALKAWEASLASSPSRTAEELDA